MNLFKPSTLILWAALLLPGILPAQCQPWAISIGGNEIELGRTLVQDNAGNLYTTIYFAGTATVGTTTYTSNPSQYGILIAKFTSEGIPVWSKQLPGNQSPFQPQLAIHNDTLYFATSFTDSLILDNYAFYTGGQSFNFELAVARLDTAGNFLWAHGIPQGVSFAAITADGSGNLIVGGQFVSTLILPNNDTLFSLYNSNAFLVKFDPSGGVEWALQDTFNGAGTSIVYSLTTDAQNNVIVGGNFRGEMAFGPLQANNANYAPDNPYVMKVSAAGSPMWLNPGICDGIFGNVQQVETDAQGDVYAAGWFNGTMLLDGDTLRGDSGTAMLLKYSAAGNLLWANQAGQYNNNTTISEYSEAIIGPDGALWAFGSMTDSSVIGGQMYFTNGSGENKIVRYSPAGNVLSVAAIPDSGFAGARDAVFDANGDPVLLGFFASPQYVIGTDTLINQDTLPFRYETFIARLCESSVVTDATVQEELATETVRIFPNPASDQVQLMFSNAFNGRVRLLDLQGRVLREDSFKLQTGQKGNISLQGLPRGMYLLELSGKNQVVKRLLKM